MTDDEEALITTYTNITWTKAGRPDREIGLLHDFVVDGPGEFADQHAARLLLWLVREMDHHNGRRQRPVPGAGEDE